MNPAEDDTEVAEQRRKLFHERASTHLNKLVATVFRWTHDREVAHEISQKAMVKYLSQMEQDNWQLEIKNEGAYLIRIARNLVSDGWRLRGKAEFVSLDQQLDEELLKTLSGLFYTSDIEKHIYLEELLPLLPWETILRGLNPYQIKLMSLQALDDLSYEEIAQQVNKEVAVVRFELAQIRGKIRHRVKALYGKKGLFSLDTKPTKSYRRTTVEQSLVESETPALGYEELNELAGKEAPALRRLVAEEAAARQYVTTRYQRLIDRKYEHGLLPSENEELDGLKAALDKMDEPFYDAIIKQLRRLVEKRGV